MSDWPRHLILVGPMGAGKSSVGRAAASLLRLPFIDTDQMVETATGREISAIFRDSGEEAFRRAETLALQRLLVLPDAVVATGGGAVMRPENWDYMTASGLVVRLVLSPEESHRRTSSDTARPLLRAEDRLSRLHQLAEEREPFYALAHQSLNTESLSVHEAAQRLVELYQQWIGQN
ncbi:MAG: shikimate kinase [Chloroflexi bacterium]|nr:shikimate kinase [Chloroflexota bacterium]